MMKRLTIDSSVIIASLLENESRHGEAMRIWDAVIAGGDVAIMPYSVFVEVVAAIRRRTGSEELANEVKHSQSLFVFYNQCYRPPVTILHRAITCHGR